MVLKHLPNSEISHVRSYGKRRFISFSPTFKQLVNEHKNVLSESLILIREIQKGKKVAKGKSGIVVEKLEFAHTNQFNRNLFRVRLNGYEFFVKESVEKYVKSEVEVWKKAQKYLDEIGNGFMGLGVKLVKPHMMVDNYLVSNFYPTSEFVNVESMRASKRKDDLVDTINQLGKNLRALGVEDVRPRNVLYHTPTKTLYLVDLISPGRYSIKQKRPN